MNTFRGFKVLVSSLCSVLSHIYEREATLAVHACDGIELYAVKE